jgi:hypothetical protein
VAQGFWLRYASIIDALRDALDKRIRAVTGGDHGSIASALITGKRDAISAPVNDAMYVSSLAHVLSISGYHACPRPHQTQATQEPVNRPLIVLPARESFRKRWHDTH